MESLLFSLISTFGAISGVFLVKLLFKKSFIAKIGYLLAITTLTTVIVTHFVTKVGLLGLIWGIPLVVAIDILALWILYKDIDFIQNIKKDLSNLSNYQITITKYKKRTDELGDIAGLVEKMSFNLNTLMSQIKENSQILTQSGNQLSASSAEISQSTNEQAATVEEISSSIEEMVATIEQNTESLQHTEELANAAEQDISETQDASQKNKDSMYNISSKIEIINEIAQKTDLLAINAAIEAAHAGEQGKGFAVVATEIRKLSENTQNAAKEIISLTEKSVNSADLANNTLNKAIPKIRNTVKKVKAISEASIEQSKTGEQINLSVQEFNSSIQQNSASTEQITTNAETLAEQSKILEKTIQQFNTL